MEMACPWLMAHPWVVRPGGFAPFAQSLWRAPRSGLGELRRRHTLFGRQRRRETLQRGSASSSRSASSLERAAERPRSVLASPTPCTTPDAQSTAVIGPLTLYLVPAHSTASGIRSPRHLCRQRPPPRPCSPSPHCSHYILITSEDYPRPRHAQRISSSNFRGDVSDIRASTTTRRRQRSLRYRRLCRRPLYNRTKTRKTKRHFIMN